MNQINQRKGIHSAQQKTQQAEKNLAAAKAKKEEAMKLQAMLVVEVKVEGK